jgi:hypothetical protein
MHAPKHDPETPAGRQVPGEQHEPEVELVRVQPIEAEVIAARLRSAGIDATVGPIPVYESVGFTDGVPVYVHGSDVAAAAALIGEDPPRP